jgi:hypothetical protein
VIVLPLRESKRHSTVCCHGDGGLLLNVDVRKFVTVLKLLACEDEVLSSRGDAFFMLNLGLHVVGRSSS